MNHGRKERVGEMQEVDMEEEGEKQGDWERGEEGGRD